MTTLAGPAGAVGHLSEQDFERRLDALANRFDYLGDVTVRATAPEGEVRRLVFRIDAPGSGLSPVGSFEYAEWFHRSVGGWQLAKYHYSFVDHVRGGRSGFHLHDLWGRSGVAHLHCAPDGSRPARHYRHGAVDILQAHRDLELLYASGSAITCAGLPELRPEWPAEPEMPGA